MPERKNDNFASIVKDSVVMTVGAEGAIFSMITDIDAHNRWSSSMKPVINRWYQTWTMAAVANAVKVYLFLQQPELRQAIIAYEGIVLSAMLVARYKMGPGSNLK